MKYKHFKQALLFKVGSGMIMVFVSFADVLVDGGLGNALIQKRNVTEDDYSTVFLSNLLFSLAVFSIAMHYFLRRDAPILPSRRINCPLVRHH